MPTKTPHAQRAALALTLTLLPLPCLAEDPPEKLEAPGVYLEVQLWEVCGPACQTILAAVLETKKDKPQDIPTALLEAIRACKQAELLARPFALTRDGNALGDADKQREKAA